MSGPALVTVGITCFNAEVTITRAIESAFAQDWPNLEVVIVDDCSSDRSAEIAGAVIAGRNNAKLIRHAANSGPAAARNTILGAAKGEFIAFFDDDDESLPGRVSAQIRHLEAYEKASGAKIVVCTVSGVRHYPNGYRLDLPAIGSKGNAPHGPEFADYLLYRRRRADWYYGGAVPSCALLARRRALLDAGGYDMSLRRVEDNDLAIRLALAGGHFIGTPDTLYIQYSTNAPDKSAERNLEAEQAMVRKHRAYLEKKGRYYYALHWHRLRYWHFKRRYGMLLVEFLGIFIRHPFAAVRHFCDTGPRRLAHERRMRRRVVA